MNKISRDVKLGKDVKVYDFVNLYGCEIDDYTKIGTFVEIQKNAKIGRTVRFRVILLFARVSSLRMKSLWVTT